ncbi:MAG: SGNH/GDSL hydrolase family protein [Planctomycetes bacterium]|nr:SGNH/GDSL hydrolase family protein [Planctomycetota bacterium]MBL7039900.1 SGNH/GDSL hydrolase family protein [Pirellulaceae bacterium]
MHTRFLKTITLSLWLTPAVLLAVQSKPAPPKRIDKPKPSHAAEYVAEPRPEDGRNLALAVTKLERGFTPPRPFLIWALGSSYTNKLGNGDQLIELLQQRVGEDREIVYKKMVGNSCPWQYLRGWARHLAIPDQPDLVLIYTIGRTPDLEKVIVELRKHTTADIIVPSIHWRERCKPFWGKSEDAPDQKVAEVRSLCEKYGVEFVENRREWAQYLTDNNLQIEDLLNDAVHQSGYGAKIVNMNIARHLHRPAEHNYDPASRERRIHADSDSVRVMPEGGWTNTDGLIPGHQALAASAAGASIEFEFTGNRVDLIGAACGEGASVFIDGKPADEVDAYYMTYIQWARTNFSERRSPARDQSPHGVRLGDNIVPQTWTITMRDDQGSFELAGSVTGTDGTGNAKQPFASDSGQIIIEPDEWRRSERNRKGDKFTWTVRRTTASNVRFEGEEGKLFRATLAANLSNKKHTVKLIADGPITVHAFDVFEPPLK